MQAKDSVHLELAVVLGTDMVGCHPGQFSFILLTSLDTLPAAVTELTMLAYLM